jgi:hypothetical protein
MRDGESFKFIGSTKDFDASVTLSHQMLGGQLDIKSSFMKVNTKAQRLADVVMRSSSSPSSPTQLDASVLCTGADGIDLCENKPDRAVFEEMEKMMLKNIFKYHNTPVRIIDTSQQIPSQLPSNGDTKRYVEMLTKVISQHFNMEDQQCLRSVSHFHRDQMLKH